MGVQNLPKEFSIRNFLHSREDSQGESPENTPRLSCETTPGDDEEGHWKNPSNDPLQEKYSLFKKSPQSPRPDSEPTQKKTREVEDYQDAQKLPVSYE